MKSYNQDKSQKLYKRAKRVIPGGLYGHYRLGLSGPIAPIYFSKSEGAKFWDVDGNPYTDYVCAYGPMILGYNHPKIDEAARKQYEKGNTVSLASPVMVELSEALVELVPIADWAFFAKNGGDTTNLSIMVARAATGRKKIIKINGGYHGVAPWMQDTGSMGTIAEDTSNIIAVNWNDVEQFENVVSEHAGEIAGFISSPYHHPVMEDNELPADGFWRKIEAICKKNGIVMITDDVRAGFRSNLKGSNEHFGFKPDLICFGKALGNGYPISALVGSEALRDAVIQVLYTGTMFFSAAPMAAALATLKELKRINAPRIVTETGKKLTGGLTDIAKSYGYDLRVTGVPSMPYLRITNDETLALHSDWILACVKRGAYFLSYHNHFISTAHTDDDLKTTWNIADDAFKAIKKKYGDRF